MTQKLPAKYHSHGSYVVPLTVDLWQLSETAQDVLRDLGESLAELWNQCVVPAITESEVASKRESPYYKALTGKKHLYGKTLSSHRQRLTQEAAFAARSFLITRNVPKSECYWRPITFDSSKSLSWSKEASTLKLKHRDGHILVTLNPKHSKRFAELYSSGRFRFVRVERNKTTGRYLLRVVCSGVRQESNSKLREVYNRTAYVDLGVRALTVLVQGNKTDSTAYSIDTTRLSETRAKRVLQHQRFSAQVKSLVKGSRAYQRVLNNHHNALAKLERRVSDLENKTVRLFERIILSEHVATVVVGDCSALVHATGSNRTKVAAFKAPNNKSYLWARRNIIDGIVAKCWSLGVEFKTKPEAHTSDRCPECGRLATQSMLQQWVCGHCDYSTPHRDVVACRNLAICCGVESRHPRQLVVLNPDHPSVANWQQSLPRRFGIMRLAKCQIEGRDTSTAPVNLARIPLNTTPKKLGLVNSRLRAVA